jgi:peptide/nickel transport system permease protein
MLSAAPRLPARLLRDPLGLLGLAFVSLIVVAAVFAPVLAPYDPTKIAISRKLEGISWEHWLGTDQLGRDTLSRVIYGARVAMEIALVSIGSAALVGLVLGIVAGSGPRWLDNILLFAFDTTSSIPMILFALGLVALLGPGSQTLILVIAVLSVPVYARLVRAQTLSIARSDFIEAERAMGADLGRILFVHLMPNVLGPLVIMVSMDIPTVVSLEASLSFLGFGVRPPTPSWGTILNDGYAYLRDAPVLVVAAGLPLVVATLGFTFLGEALRDALDPKFDRRGL